MKKNRIYVNSRDTIPVYVGSGAPDLLLLAGVHGDEKTGVAVLEKVIEELEDHQKSYPVAIIPCVNLPSYEADSRIHPKDGIDLNRIFPVRKIVSESYEIAKATQDFASKFSMVIDIHVFTGQYTIKCGVDLNIGDSEARTKIERLMSQIGMEAICRIDSSSEPEKGGSLCAHLQRNNILAFGIELPPMEVLTGNDFDSLVCNLLHFIKGVHDNNRKKQLISYVRLKVLSELAGVFSPKKTPGVEIEKGDVVGILRQSNGQEFEIISPHSGMLISISYQKNINEGDKIFVVGKEQKIDR